MRSNITDDYDKQCIESQILTRLNLANHPNIVAKEAFYKDPRKQTTQLVLEALNGMTLQETLAFDAESEESDDDFNSELLISDEDNSVANSPCPIIDNFMVEEQKKPARMHGSHSRNYKPTKSSTKVSSNVPQSGMSLLTQDTDTPLSAI